MFRSPGQRKLVLGLLLVVATLAVYNPVSHNGFVNFDDDRYVIDNAQVRAGLHWNTVSWAFTSFDQANWHPLTWLSHALDCQLFQLNPVGHHYINLLFHAANALLLFLILQWFTGYAGRSLMVAALFALHPLNVESVAWVAERKNVLSMFFFLLALAAYGWYVSKPGVMRYLSVAALFAMGLMSKPMVITLPLVLLLLDYWPLGRMGSPAKAGVQAGRDAQFGARVQPIWKLCLEKLPLLAFSALSAIVTMMAQGAGGAVLSSAAHNPRLRLENVIVSYEAYIEKAVWPFHLAALYPYPHSLPMWEVVASAIVLLAISVAILRYRERRFLVVGWLWFVVTMVPMIGLIQVGNQAMADRYAYLPMIGLFVMIVWAVSEWAQRRQVSGKILAVAGIAALLVLATLTHMQLAYWHDDSTLWSHALAVTRNNFVAENNFGNALIRRGRPDDAILHFRAAAALEPGDSASQLNLGIYAQEHGDLQQAKAQYTNALRLTTDAQVQASAYANLGTVYFALGEYAQAQKSLTAALKLRNAFPVALLDLGLIAQKTAHGKDDWNRAADYYAHFVAGNPSDVGFLLLANALHQSGRESDANWAYQQAVSLSTDIRLAQQNAAQLATR